jgi:hypothetical protein
MTSIPWSAEAPHDRTLTLRPLDHKTYPNAVLMLPSSLHKISDLSMTAKLLIGFHDAFRLRQGQAMLRTFEQPVYTVVDGRTD